MSKVKKAEIYNDYEDKGYHKNIGFDRFHWQFMLTDGRIYKSEIACSGFTTHEHCLQNMVEFAIALGEKTCPN